MSYITRRVSRRPVRGNQQPVAPSPSSILGTSLLAEWDSRRGTAANTWTDSISGRVLTGSGTPTFAVDGTFFRARSVWQFALASTQLMDTGGAGATLYAVGTKPYVSFVARATATTAGFQSLINLHDNAASVISVQWRMGGGGAADGNWRGLVVSDASADILADTSVHLFEVFLDATGRKWVSIDGVDASSDPTTGIVTATIIQRVSIGAFSGGAAPTNVNIARVRCCATVPTAAQRAQLRALDQSIWGVP